MRRRFFVVDAKSSPQFWDIAKNFGKPAIIRELINRELLGQKAIFSLHIQNKTS